MKLKHYDIIPGKHKAWYGLKRYGCPAEVKLALKRDTDKAGGMNCISERELEVNCFLSILADIKKPHINLIEAGAGWGEWCLALAGVIENKIIPIEADTYSALGIEADWVFYDHMQRNFSYNRLSAKAIYGAVSNHNGYGKFNTGFISKKYCGGSLSFNGTFKGSAIAGKALGLLNLVTGRTNRVEYFTIDYLVDKYKIDCLDILHIDVQGSELLVLEGARHSLAHRLIDYILIGTHAWSLHRKVKQLLEPMFDIVAEAIPGQVNYIHPLPPTWIEKGQDGLLLFKRKGL